MISFFLRRRKPINRHFVFQKHQLPFVYLSKTPLCLDDGESVVNSHRNVWTYMDWVVITHNQSVSQSAMNSILYVSQSAIKQANMSAVSHQVNISVSQPSSEYVSQPLIINQIESIKSQPAMLNTSGCINQFVEQFEMFQPQHKVRRNIIHVQ